MQNVLYCLRIVFIVQSAIPSNAFQLLLTQLQLQVVLDMSPLQLCLFEVINIGFGSHFFIMVANHSWMLAFLRVGGLRYAHIAR